MTSIQKLLATLVVALAITITQIAPVAAQAPTPPPTTTWTITSVTPVTDPVTGDVTGYTLVITDDMNNTQTFDLTVQQATDLGLLNPDGTVNDTLLDTTIDPALLPTTGGTEEESQHPVATKLSSFFTDLLGVSYEDIMAAHEGVDGEPGAGFGVIAQALWMTSKLGGDATMFQTIIDAKQNHDYTGITLADGSTPTNWGQFKKAVMDGDKGENLGCVMSGRANSGKCGAPTLEPTINNNVNSQNHGKSGEEHGKGKGKH